MSIKDVSLGDIQTLFQDRLLNGSADVLSHLHGDGRFIGVYDNAYIIRLLDVLAKDFPALHQLLGDDAFADAMRTFLAAHPSRERSVRWLGAPLAHWLATTQPWQDHPMLAAMATFEWALGLSFDAPDASTLCTDDLASIAPQAWPSLTFQTHPALNVIDLAFDVIPFQQAIAAETDPDAPPAPFVPAVTWAVWRSPTELIVHYRDLAADEALALRALENGADFAHLCEGVAETSAPDEAAVRTASFLRTWVESGWISALGEDGMSHA